MTTEPPPSDVRQASTPAQAWALLRAGNARFVEGTSERPNQDEARRRSTALGQNPFATIFGCMDSRVAAELVFDRGLGDLAVIRTAGHVVDNAVLGSLEFGVDGLGTPLIVVLGHDSCGAVKATLAAHQTGEMPRGYLRDLVERLTPSLVTSSRNALSIDDVDPDDLSDDHVRHTVRLLVARSPVLETAVAEGRVAVLGLGYHLADGQVQVIEAIGDIGDDAHG
jgi:carbonic anhydrase